MDKNLILKRIDQLRKERHWSVNELTQMTDLAPATIYEWYNTKKERIPSLSAIEAVCRAFEVSLSVFFAEDISERLDAKRTMLLKLTEELSESQVDALIFMTRALLESKAEK